MTDNDIIKALEHCVRMEWIDECEGCPLRENAKCITVAKRNALALINRQKAEIERLQKYNTDMSRKHYIDGTKECAEKTDVIITEIYNKFIFGDCDLGDEAKAAVMDFVLAFRASYHIDNLVKEMTEGEDESMVG